MVRRLWLCLFLLLVVGFWPQKVNAQESIRITGFGYPRNEFQFDKPFIGDGQNDYINPIWQEFQKSSNFGPSGVVKCSVEGGQFVQTIEANSLVSSGVRKFDVFLAGNPKTVLSNTEALELKAFINAGGVVYIDGGFEHIGNTNYENLFIALGIADRFSGDYDITSFWGRSFPPHDSVVVNGPFGKVGFIEHSFFRIFNNHYLMPVFQAFKEIGFVQLGIQSTNNYIVFEREIGDGYLVVAGSPFYLWTDVFENQKYFNNLISLGCELEPPVEPFLELPWDYESKNMSFTEAALAINAYFDHEYPLLSTGLVEPSGTRITTLSLWGVRDLSPYSSHDGYDYGKSKAKLALNDPILAAAEGVAKFVSSCGACGNAIHIDHKNGYQTRYYHLGYKDLITNQPGVEVEVEKGQVIGRVGYSGNVKPKGEAGSHLHFMVIHDKDKDGNFDNNIPDGVVDPFGWQSLQPDPWPNYSFVYAGVSRSGATSQYLWTHPIANLSDKFSSNAAFFELERSRVEIPEELVSEEHDIQMKSTSVDNPDKQSILPALEILITDLTGQIKENFDKPFTIIFDLDGITLEDLVIDSLRIYSSKNGLDWQEEITILDLITMMASTSVNHASYFVLAGDLKDTIPPVTTIEIKGNKDQQGRYKNSVDITFDSIDETGVEYTAYRLDGDWIEFTEPFVIDQPGIHSLRFYSEDVLGNVEEEKQLQFEIYKQSVQAKIYFDESLKDIVVVGSMDEEVTRSRSRSGERNYLVKSNTDELYITGNYTKSNNQVSYVLTSLNYGQEEINLANNKFEISYLADRNTRRLISLNQTWEQLDKRTEVSWKSMENKSVITNYVNDIQTDIVVEEGMVLLYLSTDEGGLIYHYE